MEALCDPRTASGAQQIIDQLRQIVSIDPRTDGANLNMAENAHATWRAQSLGALASRVRSAFFMREADRTDKEFSFLLKCLINTHTIGEALDEYMSFIDCFWSGLTRTQVTVAGDRVFILPNSDEEEASKLFVHELRSCSIILSTMDWLSGGELVEAKGHFAHAPIDERALSTIFPYPIARDGPGSGVSFNRRGLDKPVIRSPGEIAAFVKAVPIIAVSGMDRYSTYSGRVRTIITRSLEQHGGILPAYTVCQHLGISLPTLHRRLAAEGTHFREARDMAVNTFAKMLIREPQLATREIAQWLGYSDDGAFRRSFQRWNGESPAAYRKRHSH